MNFIGSLLAEDIDMNVEYVASVVITGITVVFIGLILLVIILFIFGLFSKVKTKRLNRKTEASQIETKNIGTEKTVKEISPAAPVSEDVIEEEIIAVIAAAVAEMGAKSGKRLAVKSIKASKPQRTAWATAGLIDNTRPF